MLRVGLGWSGGVPGQCVLAVKVFLVLGALGPVLKWVEVLVLLRLAGWFSELVHLRILNFYNSHEFLGRASQGTS